MCICTCIHTSDRYWPTRVLWVRVAMARPNGRRWFVIKARGPWNPDQPWGAAAGGQTFLHCYANVSNRPRRSTICPLLWSLPIFSFTLLRSPHFGFSRFSLVISVSSREEPFRAKFYKTSVNGIAHFRGILFIKKNCLQFFRDLCFGDIMTTILGFLLLRGLFWLLPCFSRAFIILLKTNIFAPKSTESAI